MKLKVLLKLIPLCLLLGSVAGKFKFTCRVQSMRDRNITIDTKKEKCAYDPFEGPVGKIIATFKPSKVSKAVTDHGQDLVANMAAFASFIPVVGQYIDTALTKFSNLYFDGQEDVMNKIVKEIQVQIAQLKKYVDAKVQQQEYTQLTQVLTGLLLAARSCADYGKAKLFVDQERCLVSLNTRIIGNSRRYMHRNDKIISYDWTLPLFRQFADLQLVVLQDLLSIAMHFNKTAAVKIYLTRLGNDSKAFYEHSKKAVKRILNVHTSFPHARCTTKIEYENDKNPFSKQLGYSSTCTKTLFRGRVCKEKKIFPTKKAKNGIDAQLFAYAMAITCVRREASKVKHNVRRDLQKYWKVEILNVAEQWKLLSIEAQKLFPKLI